MLAFAETEISFLRPEKKACFVVELDGESTSLFYTTWAWEVFRDITALYISLGYKLWDERCWPGDKTRLDVTTVVFSWGFSLLMVEVSLSFYTVWLLLVFIWVYSVLIYGLRYSEITLVGVVSFLSSLLVLGDNTLVLLSVWS